MHDDRPSKTAFRVALRRAAHQILDNPKVFTDPLALAIVGAEGETALRVEATRFQTPAGRTLRAFMAVRSRYAEDSLATAFENGIRQYVVLGAGLDTFAYRNPFSDLRVFEVDHPATQAWKRRRLEAGGIAIPTSMTFAPVDFESQTLADGLARAGFDAARPAFFSWLGVVPYLTRSAAMETFRFVGSRPAGSAIVFDYALPAESLSLVQRLALKALSDRVAAAGEPFRTFFEPSVLMSELRPMGFGSFEDLGTEEINARYFNGRADGLRARGGIGRLMRAGV
ncbi:MAG TPA: class I SAM-dependent methyltransferase [Thermoanaerobaculia bacterium]|jgi:methyltransferase (TIGR00027 family)